MKKYQTGEIHLVVMVIMMLSMMWFGSGHMGMRDHGAAHTEKTASTTQQTKEELKPAPAPKGLTETQH